jgi:hypothetical protein
MRSVETERHIMERGHQMYNAIVRVILPRSSAPSWRRCGRLRPSERCHVGRQFDGDQRR